MESNYSALVTELYRYALFKLRNKEKADEAVQEVFVRLLASDKRNLKDLELKRWCIGILRNVILESYKEVTNSLMYEEIDTTDLEGETISSELLKSVWVCLNNLDEESREIVTLKVWDELKFEEIAEVLAMNANTIKAKYYRAIEDLKAMLNKEPDRKTYAVSLPLLLMLLAKLKDSKLLLPNSTLFKALNINNHSMAKFSITTLSPKTIVIYATVLATVIVASAAIVVSLANQERFPNPQIPVAPSVSTSVSTTTSSTITPEQEDVEVISMDDKWNIYRFNKLGFSIRIPKYTNYFYGGCEYKSNEPRPGSSYRPVTTLTPVSYFVEGNKVYFFPEYGYKLGGQTDTDIGNGAQISNYSSCDRVTFTKDEVMTEIFMLSSWVMLFEVNEDDGQVIYAPIGQAYTFFDGDNVGLDQEIHDSIVVHTGEFKECKNGSLLLTMTIPGDWSCNSTAGEVGKGNMSTNHNGFTFDNPELPWIWITSQGRGPNCMLCTSGTVFFENPVLKVVNFEEEGKVKDIIGTLKSWPVAGISISIRFQNSTEPTLKQKVQLVEVLNSITGVTLD
ncbi:MAG: RNA polymerase sigma factor [Candidatus Doudnabacteria bacterium]|nr:RNA polymerase sigma factor [Candidatus Doudnabacteria bacterium]